MPANSIPTDYPDLYSDDSGQHTITRSTMAVACSALCDVVIAARYAPVVSDYPSVATALREAISDEIIPRILASPTVASMLTDGIFHQGELISMAKLAGVIRP